MSDNTEIRNKESLGGLITEQNADGSPAGLLTPHSQYRRLGATPEERAENYRGLVARGVSEEDLTRIRQCALKRRALGSDAFCEEMAERLGRPVAPIPRGRPKKGTDSKMNLTPFI